MMSAGSATGSASSSKELARIYREAHRVVAGGESRVDVLMDIGNLIGSDFADTLIGNGGGNVGSSYRQVELSTTPAAARSPARIGRAAAGAVRK